MPPKRKAPATAKAEPAPKKRTTRAANKDVDNDDSASSPPPKATKAKAKAKAKKETIVIDSDSEDSDVMVVDQQPKASSSKATTKSTTSKQTKAKKEPAPKKEKAAPKPRTTKAKVAAPLADPIPEAPPATKAKASPKKEKAKPVSWEEGLKEWFAKFEDEDDKSKMGGDGIEKLFEEMDVSMEGVLPFLLAWKLNAKPGTFGSFYLSDMETVFREPKINTTAGLKKFLLDVEKSLYSSSKQANNQFGGSEALMRSFYSFLFPYLKEEGQKSLNGEMAVAVWGIVLGPKYPIAKSFVEYASSLGSSFKGVSPDVWSQLFEFVQTVDDDLSGWSEEDAWPSTIDSFVEWKQEQDKKTTKA